MSAEVHLPLLYRSILKAAQRFPSIRRAAIISDIKHEFHSNKVRAGELRFLDGVVLAIKYAHASHVVRCRACRTLRQSRLKYSWLSPALTNSMATTVCTSSQQIWTFI